MGGLLDLSGLWGSRVVGFNKFEKFVFCGFQMGAVIVSTSTPQKSLREILCQTVYFSYFSYFSDCCTFLFFLKEKIRREVRFVVFVQNSRIGAVR